MKKTNIQLIKEDLEKLSKEEMSLFIFEFIREPEAYVVGRFSEKMSISSLKNKAILYRDGKIDSKDLLNEIESLLQSIAMIQDPYDREVLYSLSSAFLAFIDKKHAFDAVLHDIDALILDEGLDKSLLLVPLRLEHHAETIKRIKNPEKDDKKRLTG